MWLSPGVHAQVGLNSESRINTDLPSHDSDNSDIQELRSLMFRATPTPVDPDSSFLLSQLPNSSLKSSSSCFLSTDSQAIRLQNEVSFLKTLLSPQQSEQGPVYLVPSELYFALKETIGKALDALEGHMRLLGPESQILLQRYQGLKERVKAGTLVYRPITVQGLVDLAALLSACEETHRDIQALYFRLVDRVARGLTGLTTESFRSLLTLAHRGSREDLESAGRDNERRVALDREAASFPLLGLKIELMEDLEVRKQTLLEGVLGVQMVQTGVRASPRRKKQRENSETSSFTVSAGEHREETMAGMKRGFQELFLALRKAKGEAGRWSWKESPLSQATFPPFDTLSSLETALHIAHHDVSEIAKVLSSERFSIEQRLRASTVDLDSLQHAHTALLQQIEQENKEIAEIKTHLAENEAELRLWKEKNWIQTREMGLLEEKAGKLKGELEICNQEDVLMEAGSKRWRPEYRKTPLRCAYVKSEQTLSRSLDYFVERIEEVKAVFSGESEKSGGNSEKWAVQIVAIYLLIIAPNMGMSS